MPVKPALHRRIIRDTLVWEYGWKAVSHADGTIDVWSPSVHITPEDFERRILNIIAELHYEPTILSRAVKAGVPYIRLHTRQTLAEARSTSSASSTQK